MTEKNSGYAIPFAMWDLRLYLDTHPWDLRAIQAYRQLYAQAGGGENYAAVPGVTPLNGGEAENDASCDRRWHWVDGPWPWEYDSKGGD
ncbi:MAG: spore coat protein CotJB [Clostridia bacterium]|nr:spore coat protein CotJB [Clostridia bacterium]